MNFEHVLLALLVTLLPPLVTVAAEPPPLHATPVTLTSSERALTNWVAGQQERMLADLKQVVEVNSGTRNVEGVDQIREFFDRKLQELGFTTREVAGGSVPILTCAGGEITFANHLVAERHPGSGPRLLLSGHMDTVFPPDTRFQKMTLEGDTLAGPGVADMKGGLIAMLYALRALDGQGLLDDMYLTVLLNSDEEMGSLGSNALIQEQARQHDLGLVFEGSSGNEVVRHRKGLGQVRLKTTGRAAHSGNSHEEGLSAIRELAYKVVDIEKLTDYGRQTTVNVGMFAGGEARNTVPPCADAYVDLRYPDNEQGNHLIEQIERIAGKPHTHNPLIPVSPTTETWAVLHRPAKPIHVDSDRIMALAMGISAALEQPLGTRYSGGGTDGSIMQAVGLPSADSLGPDGTGGHSPREETSVSSLMQRTKMITVLLARLTTGDTQ